jgi:hypothetical protein
MSKNATLHSLFYLETALHVSGGTTTHNQERKQLYSGKGQTRPLVTVGAGGGAIPGTIF